MVRPSTTTWGGRPVRVLLTLAFVLSSLGWGLASSGTASADPERPIETNDEVGTYKNEILPFIPNSIERVETFADPSIIYAKDGFYYAYGTKDPRFDGDGFRVLPIIRSNDLINWTYVGDAFPNGNPPSADPSAGIFAPDVRYFNDQYYLYYAITNVTGDTGGADGPDGDDSAIGVATSPNPTGPFTDRGIAVEPQRNPCCPDGRGFFRGVIDAHVLPLPDGRRLIYYGTYNGGLDVRTLSPDGLRTTAATQRRIAIDNRYEAPYVYRRGNEYFAHVSATDCCNFELTGYVVLAGKSTSPFGPFKDKEGDSFLEQRTGGEIVLAQNGNKFVGPGHNAVITDASGQDQIVYHGINRFDPEVDLTPQDQTNDDFINRRSFMIDRLDYIGGFPVARAGQGPSEVRQPAPVAGGAVQDEFNRDRQNGLTFDETGEYTRRGNFWSVVNTRTTNYGYARQLDPSLSQTLLINRTQTPTDYRAEGVARLVQASAGQTGRYGLVTGYRDTSNFIAAYLQPAAGTTRGGSLVTAVRRGGVDSFGVTPLPSTFEHTDFHDIIATKRGGTIVFEVTESRLQDVVARQTRYNLGTAAQAGRVGFATQFASANFDNLFGVQLFTPVTQRAPDPYLGATPPGTLQERFSDEFNGGLDPENGWSYAGGRTPAPGEASPVPGNNAQARPGYYRQRTDNRELTRDNNTARVLVEAAPAGDFVVDIKLELPLPADTSPPSDPFIFFQQAGVTVRESDDRYVRLDHVAIRNTRQIEFNKEKLDPTPTTPERPRERRFGGTVLDNPETVTWLRIVARTDPADGTQRYTAYASVDGVSFERGGTWTFGGPTAFTPANERALQNRQIGITAFGGQEGQTFYNADFDYVRVYTP